MTLEKKVMAYLEGPENQARLFIYAWYIALAMMFMGYIIIGYMLFFQ